MDLRAPGLLQALDVSARIPLKVGERIDVLEVGYGKVVLEPQRPFGGAAESVGPTDLPRSAPGRTMVARKFPSASKARTSEHQIRLQGLQPGGGEGGVPDQDAARKGLRTGLDRPRLRSPSHPTSASLLLVRTGAPAPRQA